MPERFEVAATLDDLLADGVEGCERGGAHATLANALSARQRHPA
jgi:hypothetical protein